jgi:hypothetical protein
MSFRIENKYKMSLSDQKIFKDSLLSKGAKVLYPSRKINSCYFDTKFLDCFHESEDGFLPRKKVRIRWYGESNKYQKEIKISSIEGRFKIIEKLPMDNFTINSNIKIFEPGIGLLHPTLLVSYWREYLILDKLRITLDSKIKYFDLKGCFKRKLNDFECVSEVKTEKIFMDDYINRLINMPTSRFSKYCRGISLVTRI